MEDLLHADIKLDKGDARCKSIIRIRSRDWLYTSVLKLTILT